MPATVSDLELVAETMEWCARIAEQCSQGVAVELDGDRLMLGTQEETAKAIAATIRAYKDTIR